MYYVYYRGKYHNYNVNEDTRESEVCATPPFVRTTR